MYIAVLFVSHPAPKARHLFMDSKLPLSLLFIHCYWGLCEMPGCRITLYSGKSTLVLSVSPSLWSFIYPKSAVSTELPGDRPWKPCVHGWALVYNMGMWAAHGDWQSALLKDKKEIGKKRMSVSHERLEPVSARGNIRSPGK